MRTLIVMPLFNERPTVARVLAEVRRAAPDADIVVVDDGSTDGSSEVLKHTDITVISHENNQGYGQSLIDGFSYAIENRYEAVVTIDCDEQHEPRATHLRR